MKHEERCGMRRLGALVLGILVCQGAFAQAAGTSPASATSQPASAPASEALRTELSKRFEAEDLPSLAVAVVRGDERAFSAVMGVADRETAQPATLDTLYYIGSITKIFTVTLAVQLRDRGKLQLDDPISKYLPADIQIVADPRGAADITLRHLAMHTSGLPRIPNNLVMLGNDPYGGYPVSRMYDALRTMTLEFPIGSRVSYSNLGAGVLGHCLERASGKSYEVLLRELLFEPLGMKDSAASLSPQVQSRLAKGYFGTGTEVPADNWDLGSLAPAGAILSSANDMARFISLQFKAGSADAAPVRGSSLLEMQTPQRLLEDWRAAIGLGWFIEDNPEYGVLVGHNGGTSGFHSNLVFSPRHKIGVIVLTNCGKDIDEIGTWLLKESIAAFGDRERLAGEKAVRAVLERLARSFTQPPPDDLISEFSPRFLERIPPAKVSGLFAEIAGKHGTCEGVERFAPDEGGWQARARFKFAGDRRVRCQIKLDPEPPHKIVSLSLN